jgi:hypothetical protein
MPRAALLFLAATVMLVAAATAPAPSGAAALGDPGDGLPERLQDTGWSASGPGLLGFSPRYPLWSDGAGKRRWMALPAGAAIDASQPDAWDFPPGTRLWKEFSVNGRPVETRFITRTAAGDWRFGAYVWNEAGTEATLAPRRGTVVAVAGAPNGRYEVPSRTDCLACHASAAVPVLGVSAVQLPHALRDFAAGGLVRNLPPSMVAEPPRIAARDETERAALGYLHGNCAHCHNTTEARVPVGLTLAQRAADPAASLAEVLRSAVNASSRWRPEGEEAAPVVIAPGSAGHSVLARRMQSADPRVRMPPLGTSVPDPEGLALVQRWIARAPTIQEEPSQ